MGVLGAAGLCRFIVHPAGQILAPALENLGDRVAMAGGDNWADGGCSCVVPAAQYRKYA